MKTFTNIFGHEQEASVAMQLTDVMWLRLDKSCHGNSFIFLAVESFLLIPPIILMARHHFTRKFYCYMRLAKETMWLYKNQIFPQSFYLLQYN